MFWTNDVKHDIISYNDRCIDCYIDRSNSDIGWRASGLYGFSSHQQKPQTCDLIKYLFQNNNHENWLLFGDFNMVLNHAEKLGGRDIDYTHTNLFQETLNDCQLQDLGYHGEAFTWSNNQEDDQHIKERLDRFCASPHWLDRFPRVTNYHLPSLSSDHNPILLVFGTHYDSRNDTKGTTTIKRFEHIWLQDSQTNTIIKEAWTNSNEDTYTKLQHAFNKVYQWGQNTYGNVPKQIKELQLKIHHMKNKIPTKDDIDQIHQLENKLDDLLKHGHKGPKPTGYSKGTRTLSSFITKPPKEKGKIISTSSLPIKATE
jgi:hypothetical protein